MAKKKGANVVVYEAWCKGCGVCAAFCPGKVLEMTQLGKAKAARVEDCLNCGFCEMHCPDFAISVETAEERRKTPAPVDPRDALTAPAEHQGAPAEDVRKMENGSPSVIGAAEGIGK